MAQIEMFSDFKYHFVESTLPLHKEIVVDYLYRGYPAKKFIYLRHNVKWNDNDYMEAAKAEVEHLMRNGKLQRHSKKFIGKGKALPVFLVILGLAAVTLAALFTWKALTAPKAENSQVSIRLDK